MFQDSTYRKPAASLSTAQHAANCVLGTHRAAAPVEHHSEALQVWDFPQNPEAAKLRHWIDDGCVGSCTGGI